MTINFKGYNPFLKTLRADNSFRVEIDVSLDEFDNIKDIPKLVTGIYNITIEPEIEEVEEDIDEIPTSFLK